MYREAKGEIVSRSEWDSGEKAQGQQQRAGLGGKESEKVLGLETEAAGRREFSGEPL